MSSSSKSGSILSMFIAIFFIVDAAPRCGRGGGPKRPLNKGEWANSKVLADKLDHPSAIAADDKFIYFVTGGTIASQQEGTNNVIVMKIDDGKSITVFNGGDKYIPDTHFLLVDDNYIYFSIGSLVRVPVLGGEIQKISVAGMPTDFVMDDENYYWHPFVGEGMKPAPFYSLSKKGGTAKAITDPRPSANSLCIDDEFIYWIQTDGIYKMQKKGGEITKVYSTPDKQITSGLQIDADNFYFTQGDGKQTLMKVSKEGGAAKQLAPAINQTMDFLVDNKNVYFFADEGSFAPIALKKVSKNGGDVVTMDSGNAGWIKHLAQNKTHIFFTDISKLRSIEK